MSKFAYLDCPTGIAGDMCLGALVDAGVPLSYLVEQLGRLGIAREYSLRAESVHRNGQRATKVHVDLRAPAPLEHQDIDAIASAHPLDVNRHRTHSATESSIATVSAPPHSHSHQSNSHQSHPHPHSHEDSHTHTQVTQAHTTATASTPSHTHSHSATRHLPEIEQLITAANLPSRATAWSLAVFRQLAVAEGAVHGIAPAQVHFHEVGATDAIVDIVGTCLGLDWLGIDYLYCSALPTGGGTIRAAHGRLPVPAPATLKLFEQRQVPLYSNGIEREMVTPTGAAIVTTLATQFGPPPPMTLQKVGLGAGSASFALPNILRLWIGEGDGPEGMRHPATPSPLSKDSPTAVAPRQANQMIAAPSPLETIAVLETQIDDLNPQAIGYVLAALLAAGALDVFTQAIGMKKSRPGTLLTVICDPDAVSACETIIFRETTTLGIRRSTQQRRALPREIQTVSTPYGDVRVKVAWLDPSTSTPSNVQPEYDDCARIAQQQQRPWREIQRLALEGWYQQWEARTPNDRAPSDRTNPPKE